MGYSIHRVTKQVLENPQSPAADWFYVSRPDGDAGALADLEALRSAGVPPQYWELHDGPPKSISEMSVEQKRAIEESKLPEYKARKISEIDSRTGQLINHGFEYPPGSGTYYSMSAQAQINMTNLLMIKDSPLLTYPIKYNSKDDGAAITINNAAEIAGFYGRALGVLRGILDSGTGIKDSVRAATTLAELEAVKDAR